MTDYLHQYAKQIEENKVVVGKWIRLLYQRVTKALADGDYLFDEDKAKRAIEFIETFCHHCEGRDDLLKLELWQKALVSVMFGCVEKDGTRVFREVFVVIARKNGKSLLASAIIAYMAYMDKEYGAKIYCLAPKLDQAAIVYENFYKMVQAEPELSAIAQKRRSDVYLEMVNTSVRPLAFNAKKSDGFNPHFTVCDEIASWSAEQGLKQYEVMKSALGARKQPMIFSISTAGYINDGIYDELFKRSTAVLEGSSEERRLLPVIYQIDDIEKWDDFEELKKSNPNMGVSVNEDFYKDEIAVAKNSASKKAEFMTKYCNIKQNSTAAWMPYEVIDADCKAEISLDNFRNSYCVGGIDLSQTTDLTACSCVIEKEGILYAFCQFFMPENKIDELSQREGIPYRIYQKKGFLTASGENYVDYKDCFNWFRMLVEDYQIYPLQIGYDRYSAQYLIQDLQAYGFHTDDVFQGENLTPVIRECDGLLRDGVLQLGNNQLLEAHFLNVAMKQNTETRKIRPVKIEERCHIDGFVSVIDALTVRQKWYEQIGGQLRND